MSNDPVSDGLITRLIMDNFIEPHLGKRGKALYKKGILVFTGRDSYKPARLLSIVLSLASLLAYLQFQTSEYLFFFIITLGNLLILFIEKARLAMFVQVVLAILAVWVSSGGTFNDTWPILKFGNMNISGIYGLILGITPCLNFLFLLGTFEKYNKNNIRSDPMNPLTRLEKEAIREKLENK